MPLLLLSRNLASTFAIRQGQHTVGWNLKHGAYSITCFLNLITVQANGDIVLDPDGFRGPNLFVQIIAACRQKPLTLFFRKIFTTIELSRVISIQIPITTVAFQLLCKDGQVACPMSGGDVAVMRSAAEAVRVWLRRLRRGWQQRQAQGQRHQTA